MLHGGLLVLALLACGHVGVGSAPNEQVAVPAKYSVRVSARLRPLPRDDTPATSAANDAQSKVVLPLHQRLQLIQAREQCSRTDSRRLLWQSRGGQQDAWAAAEARVPSQGTTRKVDDDEEMGEEEIEEEGVSDVSESEASTSAFSPVGVSLCHTCKFLGEIFT